MSLFQCILFNSSVFLFSRSNASDETVDPLATENDENNSSQVPPQPPQPKIIKTRKLTAKEIEHETKMCTTLEQNLAKLKLDLTDKKVIFDKLMAELFRMLGVFDRLEKLHETKGNEIVEAEQAVSIFYTLLPNILVGYSHI